MTELSKLIKELKEKKPLIHAVTNPISINQCANSILSVGARPIMAEHPKEVKSITKNADALMLNLGNITDARIKSIILSARTASKNKIPFLVDAVGVNCSDLRKRLIKKLLSFSSPSVVKGNYSEIKALYDFSYTLPGIDADTSVSEEYIKAVSAKLARKYNTIILASGKTDIITNGKRIILAKNGSSYLTKITGTGCMLGALCTCFLSVRNDISAPVTACALMGICGELAETNEGNQSFFMNLMNKLSTLTSDEFENNLNMEEENEKI